MKNQKAALEFCSWGSPVLGSGWQHSLACGRWSQLWVPLLASIFHVALRVCLMLLAQLAQLWGIRVSALGLGELSSGEDQRQTQLTLEIRDSSEALALQEMRQILTTQAAAAPSYQSMAVSFCSSTL